VGFGVDGLGDPQVFDPRVDDALGPVRLLFAIEREGTDLDRMKLLTEVGKTLVECLEVGHHHRDRPETLGYRAAVNRSADAVDKLAAMAWPAHVGEFVRVAQSRVKGAEARKLDARDAKKAVTVGRG
jgi:Zn ribbon nucleic-acid-binding protein